MIGDVMGVTEVGLTHRKDAVWERAAQASVSLDLKVGSQREAGAAWPILSVCAVVPVRFDR